MEHYTHITVCLDRSGSMASVRDATISGFNEFMDIYAQPDPSLATSRTTLTLVGFDDVYEMWAKMQPATYRLSHEIFVPRNMTALHDAMGKSIVDTGEHLKALPEAERPEHVLFVTITDGLENASKEFTAEAVAKMIKTQRDIYKWEAFFIGANQDAVLTAQRYNIPERTAITYASKPEQVRSVFRSAGIQAKSASLGRRPVFSGAARAAALGKKR